MKYLLEMNTSSVSECNADGKLPIHLLCEAEIDEVGEESGGIDPPRACMYSPLDT